MTGRIRDIGQNVLLSAFVAGGSISSSTITAVFVACGIPGGGLMGNVVIILRINYNVQ